MEKEICFAWYRLRGLGLLCLCSFVFFFGAYLANQRSVAVNGPAGVQTMPVDCIQREDSALALSFDVTKGSGSIGALLDVLEKYDTEATFFVTADWADAHPEEAKRIAEEGHDVGCRGFDRESMTGRPVFEVREFLEAENDRIEALTGVRMKLFRAPYGQYDSALIRAATEEGFLPVGWSVDSEDWKDYGIESIVKKVTLDSQLGAGAIIRMHGGARHIAPAVGAVIEDLRRQGYVLTSVSKLL